MRSIFLFAVALVLLFSCQTNKKKAVAQYEKALSFIKKKEIANASKAIEIGINLDSSNYDLFILKAKIKSDESQYEESIKLLGLTLKNNFKPYSVNYLIGQNYFYLGNYYKFSKPDQQKSTDAYNKSVEFLNDAIKINSQRPDPYVLKQKVLNNSEKYDEAIITINSALRIFPDNQTLIFSRGVAKIELGDKIGALTDLNNAIQSKALDSFNMSNAYRFKANIYLEMDSLSVGLSNYTQAINYNPKSDLSYAARGETYRLLNNMEKACSDYRKAADLGLVTIYEEIKKYCYAQ